MLFFHPLSHLQLVGLKQTQQGKMSLKYSHSHLFLKLGIIVLKPVLNRATDFTSQTSNSWTNVIMCLFPLFLSDGGKLNSYQQEDFHITSLAQSTMNSMLMLLIWTYWVKKAVCGNTNVLNLCFSKIVRCTDDDPEINSILR